MRRRLHWWPWPRSSATDGLIDVQWSTPHLASLGVVEWPRATYLAALPALVDAPPLSEWAR